MTSYESNMDIVESSDYLLMEILLRLPPKSAFKLRFVSNRWSDIISGSYFRKLYRPKFCLLALIQPTPNLRQEFPEFLDPKLYKAIDILPIHPGDDKYVCKQDLSKYGFFIASSNGLVLTGYHAKNTYFVMNPLTSDHVVALPPPLEIYQEPNMTLLYDEENEEFIPKYRIISTQSGLIGNRKYMQVYSSNTRKWTLSILKGVEDFVLANSKPPIVSHGFIHWYSTLPESLVVLDTRDLIVDGGENHIQLIRLPGSEEFRFNPHEFTFTRSSSGDQLWFGAINAMVMKFWMLPHKNGNGNATINNTKWVVMDTICLDSLHKNMTPFVRSMSRVYRREKTNKHILKEIETGHLSMGGLIPWNDTVFVVIRLNLNHLNIIGFGYNVEDRRKDRFFLYNLQSKSYELLNYSGINHPEKGCYPYMEPHTLSSYGSLR